MTDLPALLRRASSSEYALDSSKLRSGATRRVETEGLVKIEKYHQAVAYLVSPALVEEFAELAVGRDQLQGDLRVAAHLLMAALKLGVAPDQAVQALLDDAGEGAQLNVAMLASLLESAADDFDAAAAARERMSSPPEGDITLEQLAADLGFDPDQIRGEVGAGDSRAQLATS